MNIQSKTATYLVALVLSTSSSSLSAERTVTLTGDPWPPYMLGELGQEATGGVGRDLILAIFDRIDGVEVSFPLIPWKRALREVRAGTKDGIAILLKTAEREHYIDYTDELFASLNLVWYSRKRFAQGFEWDNLSDLKRYRLGITRDYSYGETIDRAIEDDRLAATQVTTVNQLFAMLAQNRVDLALANDVVGCALAKQYSGIVAAQKETGADVYHIGFSKLSPARALISSVDRIISELKEERIIDKMIRCD